jgi:hypothetical protein
MGYSRATKIAHTVSTSIYYFTASLRHFYSIVKEKMMCWWLAFARKIMWWWICSFGNPYYGDALQYAKQKNSARLPQMTKYCIMRECENILHGYLYVFDLAFSHHDGIHGFKFPSRFFGDLLQRSHFSFTKLKHPKSPTFGIDALSFCIHCLPSSHSFPQSSSLSLLAVILFGSWVQEDSWVEAASAAVRACCAPPPGPKNAASWVADLLAGDRLRRPEAV